MKIINQINFSSLLFDTLFGVILFFAIDSLLEIMDPYHFVFYIFSTFILIHWWLIFKSSDDVFKTEVTDSAADIVFGLIDIILIQYIILMSKAANYQQALYFLIALFAADLVWAIVWKYVGEWETRDHHRIAQMNKELNTNIYIDLVFILLFLILAMLFVIHNPGKELLVAGYISLYLAYIFYTFKYKLLDIRIF